MRVLIKRIEDQRKLLMEKYKGLWKISLFISPKIDLHDSCYRDLPNVIPEVIEKISKIIGVELSPTVTQRALMFPQEISEIIKNVQSDSRSYKTLEDLLNLSCE
jgi:hypothetical protein